MNVSSVVQKDIVIIPGREAEEDLADHEVDAGYSDSSWNRSM